MISISTTTANVDGQINIQEGEKSDFGSHTARVFRSKTLDGGVYISQPQFIDGDRTFRVKTDITEDEETRLLYLKDQGHLNISCVQGFFSGVIEKISCQNGDLDMSIFIKERLDQE